MRSLYAGFRWLGAVLGSSDPMPSSSRPCLSGCLRACRCRPRPFKHTHSGFGGAVDHRGKPNDCLSPRSMLTLIVERQVHSKLAHFGGKTCSWFCSPCSILLKSWSLLQNRSGSGCNRGNHDNQSVVFSAISGSEKKPCLVSSDRR